jgi:hypothetical protein
METAGSTEYGSGGRIQTGMDVYLTRRRKRRGLPGEEAERRYSPGGREWRKKCSSSADEGVKAPSILPEISKRRQRMPAR